VLAVPFPSALSAFSMNTETRTLRLAFLGSLYFTFGVSNHKGYIMCSPNIAVYSVVRSMGQGESIFDIRRKLVDCLILEKELIKEV